MAARRDQVVKRLWTGLKTLIDKNKVTWIQGRGRLEGPTKVRVSQPGEDGTPGKGGDRVLEANDVILATGSRVKSLPGLEPDGKRIVTTRRRPDERHAAEGHRRRRQRRRRRRVRLDVPRPRHRR